MTSISGIAEIIKNGIVDDKDIPEFAGKIYDEARRLISLVEDIIRVSQLDEGETMMTRQAVDLYEVANQTVSHLKDVAAKRNITIKLSGAAAVVQGVPSVIDEMIFNLCDNAIKYNKDNGEVEVSVKTLDETAVVSVKDTGIGIAKEQQGRIFERFYRVDKSHSKEIGGTGLGLSIVKHGAKIHNADVSVHSTLGKGTEITISFPLV